MIQMEGRNAVFEALKGNRVVRVMIAHDVKNAGQHMRTISDLSRGNSVLIESTTLAELDRLSATGHHQGIIAYVKPPNGRSLKHILRDAGRTVCVLLLHQVQDPRNLGAILRTAASTGVSCVLIPKRQSVDMTPAVHRVSMGGSLYVPVVKQSLYSALKLLRTEGIRIIGVDPSGSMDYFSENLSGAIALVLGGEDRGISPPLLARCDRVVRIPMLGRLKTLNVSVATAIVLYERVRQRMRP
jgi:23S rRNA (guanosine2251-2'-O)-methyltransferase